MVNDPIGDMLIQIKNATLAGRLKAELPYSRIKEAVAKILVEEGYLESIQTLGQEPKTRLQLVLKYNDSEPVITNVKRMSKPGLRRYVGKHEIPQVVGGMGIAIISTPQGMMTGKEAKKRGLGGELICTVW